MMEEQKTSGIPLTGFLVVGKTVAEDGYVAALMVTDNRGYPLEFKASTPIRPSLVQKTLYGGQLEHFIGVELCGKTLIQQLANFQRGSQFVGTTMGSTLGEPSHLETLNIMLFCLLCLIRTYNPCYTHVTKRTSVQWVIEQALVQ